MTVSSDVAKIVHVSDQAVTSYAFPFKIFEAGQLSASVNVSGTTVETALALGRHYTIAASSLGQDTGGEIVLTAAGQEAAGTGNKLILLRSMGFVQETDYKPYDVFPAETHERALDILTMQDQELREALGRTLKYPPSAEPPYPDSADYLAQVKAWADDARASAEMAAKVAEPGALASNIYNIRKAWVLDADMASGDVLTLPDVYFPTRNVLTLFYEGTVCALRNPLVESSLEYQYEEVGDDLNTPSNQVTIFFAAKAGDVFDMLVTHSGLSYDIEEVGELLQGYLADAQQASFDAASARDAAQSAAGEAAQSVVGQIIQYVDQAQASASTASADAIRAEDAADRAEAAAGVAEGDIPLPASEEEVTDGTVTDKFVSPKTAKDVYIPRSEAFDLHDYNNVADLVDANTYIDYGLWLIENDLSANFPVDTRPLFFKVDAGEAKANITQWAWAADSTLYLRSGTVDRSDPENPTAAWGEWRLSGSGSFLTSQQP